MDTCGQSVISPGGLAQQQDPADLLLCSPLAQEGVKQAGGIFRSHIRRWEMEAEIQARFRLPGSLSPPTPLPPLYIQSRRILPPEFPLSFSVISAAEQL